MSLVVESRTVGGISILDLQGKITLGESTSTLRDEILSLIAQGQGRILLNLGRVSYMDSAGLGELVSAYSTVKRHGGVLRLMRLGPKLRGLMQVTKLHTVFAIFDNEAAALASFGG